MWVGALFSIDVSSINFSSAASAAMCTRYPGMCAAIIDSFSLDRNGVKISDAVEDYGMYLKTGFGDFAPSFAPGSLSFKCSDKKLKLSNCRF